MFNSKCRSACVAPATVVVAAMLSCTPRAIVGDHALQSLVIRHVNVVDVQSGAVRRDVAMRIAGGRIIAIDSALTPRSGERVFDAGGGYATPGLWDMHAHVVLAGRAALPQLVAFGITGVREAGGDMDSLLTWRHEIDAGKLLGPRIVAAGTVIEGASWLSRLPRIDSVVQSLGAPRLSFMIPIRRRAVRDTTEVEVAVAEIVSHGAEFVKARTSESAATFLATARAARRAGLPFVSHPPPRSVSWLTAAREGLTGLEHAGGAYVSAFGSMTAAVRSAEFAALAHEEFFLDPNLVCDAVRALPDSLVAAEAADTAGVRFPRMRGLPKNLSENFRREAAIRAIERQMEPPGDVRTAYQKELALVREAHLAGVPIVTGTDLGALLIFPGQSVHDELAIFVKELGFSPLQALQSATMLPARAMRRSQELGNLAPGYLADIVIVRGNPLEDISRLKRPQAVFVGGRRMK